MNGQPAPEGCRTLPARGNTVEGVLPSLPAGIRSLPLHLQAVTEQDRKQP